MSATTPPQVFISYSRNDAALVQPLKEDLKRAGVVVWLDHEQLKPGEPDWQAAVLKGIEQAATVIYAASPDAAVSRYVGHELAIARDEGKTILPFWIRGEKWARCAPLGFYYAQYIDGRDAAYSAGLAELKEVLGIAPVMPPSEVVASSTGSIYATTNSQYFYPMKTGPRISAISPERFPARLAELGYEAHARDGVEWIVPPICPVSAGPFRLGSDKARDKAAEDNELQRATVTLGIYEIARFPVTVAEYACFAYATKRNTPSDWNNQLQRLDHPVVYVSWLDAFDYTAWLAQRTGQPWRLPTEAEWEKAARCDSRDPLGASSERIYPWGDTFDAARCNTNVSAPYTTTPVGWYGPDDPKPEAGRESGASPCGAEDLAGNVWEWTASDYAKDYSASGRSSKRNAFAERCMRGGSWSSGPSFARAAYRSVDRSIDAYAFVGFRLTHEVLAHPLPPPPPEMVLW